MLVSVTLTYCVLDGYVHRCLRNVGHNLSFELLLVNCCILHEFSLFIIFSGCLTLN